MRQKRNRDTRERGQAVVEVTLMMPWIVFLSFGVFDFGFYAHAAICTQNAARAAAVAASGCADQAAGQCLASQTTQEIVNENHVTANSPGITIEPGNPKLHLRGVLYQPRGAWMVDMHGTGFSTGDLQIITGSFQLTTGNDKLLLQGPTNPLITYKTALIQ